MAKLTKTEATGHLAALALLNRSSLSPDERWEILEKYREDAEHANVLDGAFFTPVGLARDFGIEVPACRRLIDLCAGVGALAYMHSRAYRARGSEPVPEIVCLERNPDYVAVGKILIPEAVWIEADVFDLPKLGLGHFDVAISNPPFGSVTHLGPRGGQRQRSAQGWRSRPSDHGRLRRLRSRRGREIQGRDEGSAGVSGPLLRASCWMSSFAGRCFSSTKPSGAVPGVDFGADLINPGFPRWSTHFVTAMAESAIEIKAVLAI